MAEQLNVRVPEITEKQVKDLLKWTGMTQTQLVILAIDHLHQEYKEEQRKQGGQGDAATERP